MNAETNITNAIMLALPPATRAFRNNVGMGWTGKAIRKGSLIIIENPRPLHAGLCEGSSDLIGWTTMQITPDMVGHRVAVFTALEVKTATGRPSNEQLNFIQRVRDAGGIAGIARTPQEAQRIITEFR